MMLYKDVINLVSISSTRNANGYPEPVETKTEIYADVQSVKRSEFYEALRSGIEATIVFKVFAGDYAKQKYVDHDGVRYKVIRAYMIGDWTELNCREAKANESE